jgi:hypothetical protein
MSSSRVNTRQGFDEKVRLTLAEEDLDKNDAAHVAMANELKSIRNILMGLLVTIATSSIAFAVGVAVGAI